MFTSKKIIWTIVGIFVVVSAFVLTPAVNEYLEWTKIEAQVAGFPVECGILRTTVVTPGCNRGPLGKCTCALCEASPCNGNTEIQFEAQKTPKCTTNFFCVDPSFANWKGTKVPPQPGDQAIVGATSNIITGNNAVYAVPSVAVKRIQRFADAYDYVMALFK